MSQDLYQEIILETYRSPQYKGSLADVDVTHVERNASCGDEVTVQIKMDQARKNVLEIRWQGEGCAISLATLDLLIPELQGQTVENILKKTKTDLLQRLGLEEISPGREKCLMLGLRAIQKGLQDA